MRVDYVNRLLNCIHIFPSSPPLFSWYFHFYLTEKILYIKALYCNTSHQRGQCILFSVVFTPSPPCSTHRSVWLLPAISLLLYNTVSPVQACLIIWWERLRGTQKEDDRGPVTVKSSNFVILLSEDIFFLQNFLRLPHNFFWYWSLYRRGLSILLKLFWPWTIATPRNFVFS